jgi:ubiquinone/menaquinone biosynthesis C-methylase UbiE
MTGENRLEEEAQLRNRINLNPIGRLFENPQQSIAPYVRKGQVVADLGCNTGHYTFALADCVGSEGKVYAVDMKEEYIRALEKEGEKRGYHSIEWYCANAADLNFIQDESVDDKRHLVVNEIQRILKPAGQAYLSLGGVSPFFGFVGREEWERILETFIIKQRGGLIQKWAAVSKKENSTYIEGNDVKRPRFLKFRKKAGE